MILDPSVKTNRTPCLDATLPSTCPHLYKLAHKRYVQAWLDTHNQYYLLSDLQGPCMKSHLQTGGHSFLRDENCYKHLK